MCEKMTFFSFSCAHTHPARSALTVSTVWNDDPRLAAAIDLGSPQNLDSPPLGLQHLTQLNTDSVSPSSENLFCGGLMKLRFSKRNVFFGTKESVR